jgi:hypothetical protein
MTDAGTLLGIGAVVVLIVLVAIGARGTVTRARGTAAVPSAAALPDAPIEGATMIRRYGGSYRTATRAFEADAALHAELQWAATSVGYVPGQWRLTDFVVAFLLMPIVVGWVVLAYLVAVKPPGELVVTYEYRPSPGRRPTGPGERLRRLAELRDIGIVSEGEYEAKRADLVAQL